jgi:hypothetical protein
MVEIRVAVADAAGAHGLLRRLAAPFDRSSPGLWHCNCRTPLGPYQLNSAQLTRCPVCGVARHSDPTVAANVKLAAHSPASGAGRTSPPR